MLDILVVHQDGEPDIPGNIDKAVRSCRQNGVVTSRAGRRPDTGDHVRRAKAAYSVRHRRDKSSQPAGIVGPLGPLRSVHGNRFGSAAHLQYPGLMFFKLRGIGNRQEIRLMSFRCQGPQ